MTVLDTNVLIYACDKSEPERQQKALTLIDRVTDGVLPWQVACEFIAATRKLQGQGFTPADAGIAWPTSGSCSDSWCLRRPCWRLPRDFISTVTCRSGMP